MNVIAILIGLGPLVGWGLFPTIASKFGGKPVNQLLGSTVGTFIFALIYYFVAGLTFPTGFDLLFSVLSGVGWGSAMIITFYCFNIIGSSITMPITTAFQLLGTSLWGVFILGNWPGITAKLVGAVALIALIYGAKLTVWSETPTEENKALVRKVVILLAIAEIGYLTYSAAPQATALTGKEAFLPQSLGMMLVGITYGIVMMIKNKNENPFTNIISYKQIFSGFFFAFAALTFLISAQPNMNGLATGFILSQTSVVLSTLTGIWFLGQKKTPKELRITLFGLALILISASVTIML